MSTFRLNNLAQTVGAALVLAYASSASAVITPPPGGVAGIADAYMNFTNFQFRAGNNAFGHTNASGEALPSLSEIGVTITGTEKSTAQAVLNGVASTNVTGCEAASPLGQAYTCIGTIGSGFDPLGPYAPVLTTPLTPLSGSGGLSSSTGDSREGTATVYLHSLSQLATGGDTNASATQGVSASYEISVALEGARVALSFDLERLVRAGLAQDGITASADTKFNVLIKDATGKIIFNWLPSGIPGFDNISPCFFEGYCATYSDPFSMQSSVFVDTTGDKTSNAVGDQIDFAGVSQTGYFEAELTFRDAGKYTFEIISSATSAVKLNRIPEPGTIALLGLGLLGLGVTSRRRIRV